LLFFENSVFVKTTPNLYQPPWNAIFLLVIDVFFVFFVTMFKIHKGQKNNALGAPLHAQ